MRIRNFNTTPISGLPYGFLTSNYIQLLYSLPIWAWHLKCYATGSEKITRQLSDATYIQGNVPVPPMDCIVAMPPIRRQRTYATHVTSHGTYVSIRRWGEAHSFYLCSPFIWELARQGSTGYVDAAPECTSIPPPPRVVWAGFPGENVWMQFSDKCFGKATSEYFFYTLKNI